MTMLWKDSQFGHNKIRQFGRIDALYVRADQSGRPVLRNGNITYFDAKQSVRDAVKWM